MTDTDPTSPVYTSACGNVTVLGGADAAPQVHLTLEAVRLPARDLAELITWTAREAADAARAEGQDGPGSAVDALAKLRSLRDGLRDDGLEAVIERERAGFGTEPDLAPDDPRTMSRLALGGTYPTAGLDLAISLLERFQPDGPAATVNLVGRASGPEDAVTVEATGEYPIALVLLGAHARELGPDALAKEITETAAKAGADLRERQAAQIDAMGLPLSMKQVDGLPDEMNAYGRKVLGQSAHLRGQHDDITRRLHE